MDTLITITIILIIIGSILALELKDLLSAVIALGVAGYGISVIFLLAGAPDLAITQIVVEILALVILIRAMVSSETFPQRRSGARLAALVLTAVFAIGSFLYFSSMALVAGGGGLPDFGSPVMKVSSVYIRDSLEKVGASNIVSAIILDWRAIDTLGEATVLFAAALGVVAILRKESLSSKSHNPDDKTDGRE